MARYKSACLAALALTLFYGGSASSLQQPLLAGGESQQSPLATSKRPLVDSEALQAAISGDSLLERAKDLYKIAELSLHEYNHPTRVIGSDGESPPWGTHRRAQGPLALKPFSPWALTRRGLQLT